MDRDYQPEGVKYTYPDDDPYQESNEIYYNMVRQWTEIILSQQTTKVYLFGSMMNLRRTNL